MVRELDNTCSRIQVQEMELSIMNIMEWRLFTSSPSEISLYFLKKFWKERLNKGDQGFPLTPDLLGMIHNFIEKGLLFKDTLGCSYSEIAVSSVGLLFECISLHEESIGFISWCMDFLPLNLVVYSLLEQCGNH